MRCPDCNKFVPYDDSQEPEHNLDVDDTGHVTGDVRIVLPCGECGTELKEYSFDIDIQAEIDHKCEGEDPDYSVEVSSVELTTQSDCGINKRTGKPNKFNPRYATTYYGFSLTGEVRCSCGKATIEFTAEDKVSASSMDEMV